MGNKLIQLEKRLSKEKFNGNRLEWLHGIWDSIIDIQKISTFVFACQDKENNYYKRVAKNFNYNLEKAKTIYVEKQEVNSEGKANCYACNSKIEFADIIRFHVYIPGSGIPRVESKIWLPYCPKCEGIPKKS